MSDSHIGKPGSRLGTSQSQETRDKIAATLKAKIAAGVIKPPTTLGLTFSAATKENMSNSQKGRTSYWKGKKLPPSMVEKMHLWH